MISVSPPQSAADARARTGAGSGSIPQTATHRARIAIFLPELAGGGAERVLLNLGQGLLARNYDVDLLLAQNDGPLTALVPSGVRVVKLNRRVPVLRTCSALPMLVRYLRSAKPDALVSGLERANIVALLARKLSRVKTRTAVSVHQVMADPSTQPQPWYSRVEYTLARRLYPTADYVVAVSRGAADALAGRLSLCAESINVIYNPVLTPELRQRAAYDPNHPWLQANSPPMIVAAGRFDEPKDFVTLIAAFGMLRQRRNARLLILGEGPTRPRLETLVKQLGLESDVQMPGFQANPYPFIAAARLFVLSSRSEALPTVVVEALYLGTPVIATDCPGGVREILQDGRYGRLIPVANEESMADSMEELLSQHPGIQPEESWRRFTVDAATDAYVRLLFGPSAGEMTGSLQQDYVRNHESN